MDDSDKDDIIEQNCSGKIIHKLKNRYIYISMQQENRLYY